VRETSRSKIGGPDAGGVSEDAGRVQAVRVARRSEGQGRTRRV